MDRSISYGFFPYSFKQGKFVDKISISRRTQNNFILSLKNKYKEVILTNSHIPQFILFEIPVLESPQTIIRMIKAWTNREDVIICDMSDFEIYVKDLNEKILNELTKI
jgi:hypothetical protein